MGKLYPDFKLMLAGGCEIFGDEIPVDQVIHKVVNETGSGILEVEVVGVFPNVQSQ